MTAVSKTARDQRMRRARAWLKSESKEIGDVAEAVGVDYNSAYQWFHEGVRPRRLARSVIADKFPGCPLAE